MKKLYKLRDGPLDWYFCNSEHALDWLEHRHRSHSINAVLRLRPKARAVVLAGRTIEQFVHEELSHEPSSHAHAADRECVDDLCDGNHDTVSLCKNAQLSSA